MFVVWFLYFVCFCVDCVCLGVYVVIFVLRCCRCLIYGSCWYIVSVCCLCGVVLVLSFVVCLVCLGIWVVVWLLVLFNYRFV